MKIILLNGPPRCGKDTLGAAIVEALTPGEGMRMKFATELKRMTHRLYGLMYGPEHFEDRKDQPCSEFYGATPRQAYIAVSEKLVKPLHGKDFFGERLADDVESWRRSRTFVAVTDSGFREEAEVLVRRFGAGNVFLVRLARLGTDFKNDSRGYVDLDLPEGHVIDLRNDGPIEDVPRLASMVLGAVALAGDQS